MAVTALAVRLELSALSLLPLVLLSLADGPCWTLALWLVPAALVLLPAVVPSVLVEPPVLVLLPEPAADPAEAAGTPPALKLAPEAAAAGVFVGTDPALAPVLPTAAPATGSWTGM